jgi:RNA polymerase sigma factor (sigma-70 family)
MIKEFSTDQQLIEGMRENRNAAFNHIYKNVYPSIQALIQRNSGTEENARDIFQEAMIIFYEKVLRTDFELTASVQTYLYAVSRNLWLKFLRDNRREIPVDLQDQKSENLMRDENPFFKNDRVNTLTKSVHQYLDKLGNPCRNILIYYYYFKLSMDAIAERLGYSNSNSVKSQKYKCIERLKKTVPDNLKTLLYTN